MKKLAFDIILPENPKGTAQMIRHTSHGTYLPKNLQATMRMYQIGLASHGGVFLDGPLSLSLKFVYAVKDKKKWLQPKTSVPDVDNIAKPFIDCMTKTGFWNDDSQIVKLKVEKWYGPVPMVGVELAQVAE